MFNKDDCCKECDKYCAHESHYPIVTLGQCVKWDTECENGSYNVVPGSNVDILKEYIEQKRGSVSWCTECHGETIICMDSPCQLKDALVNHNAVLRGKLG